MCPLSADHRSQCTGHEVGVVLCHVDPSTDWAPTLRLRRGCTAAQTDCTSGNCSASVSAGSTIAPWAIRISRSPPTRRPIPAGPPPPGRSTTQPTRPYVRDWLPSPAALRRTRHSTTRGRRQFPGRSAPPDTPRHPPPRWYPVAAAVVSVRMGSGAFPALGAVVSVAVLAAGGRGGPAVSPAHAARIIAIADTSNSHRGAHLGFVSRICFSRVWICRRAAALDLLYLHQTRGVRGRSLRISSRGSGAGPRRYGIPTAAGYVEPGAKTTAITVTR